MNQHISSLIIVQLLEAEMLDGIEGLAKKTIIRNIASLGAVLGEKNSIAFPSMNKINYVETVNKYCGTIEMVLDELVEVKYLIQEGDLYKISHQHDYIKKFMGHHQKALHYVSHPAYDIPPKAAAEVKVEEAEVEMKVEAAEVEMKAEEVEVKVEEEERV